MAVFGNIGKGRELMLDLAKDRLNLALSHGLPDSENKLQQAWKWLALDKTFLSKPSFATPRVACLQSTSGGADPGDHYKPAANPYFGVEGWRCFAQPKPQLWH
jgi:hypothetical protein